MNTNRHTVNLQNNQATATSGDGYAGETATMPSATIQKMMPLTLTLYFSMIEIDCSYVGNT